MNNFDSIVSTASLPTSLIFLTPEDYTLWSAQSSETQRALAEKQSFAGKQGQIAWISEDGKYSALVGSDGKDNLNTLGDLPFRLPEGQYSTKSNLSELQLTSWAMGAYRFDRYKISERQPAQLEISNREIRKKVLAIANSVSLARDLINTPAADMKPSDLEAEVFALAQNHDASFDSWVGEQLLDNDCGAIYAVGKASDDPPRLIDLTWGETKTPQIVLIGKGVTFDSGGLNIKPASGMRQMKKDMGGAAIAIGLANLIMERELPISLRLLIPAAENCISDNSFRPGDILSTRKGLTVEIDNTDAEGRLLLCDALALASESNPDLIIDFATLTGAARSAVGADISAMFTDSDQIAETLFRHGKDVDDPLWRLPLFEGYDHMLNSKIADLVNSSSSGFAGAITAALFLKKFIVDQSKWVHFDLMAYNTKSRPARPEGGEAMSLRAVFSYLEKNYVSS